MVASTFQNKRSFLQKPPRISQFFFAKTFFHIWKNNILMPDLPNMMDAETIRIQTHGIEPWRKYKFASMYYPGGRGFCSSSNADIFFNIVETANY